MPIFCYRCPKCEQIKELVFTIRESDKIISGEIFPIQAFCENCNIKMVRDFSMQDLAFQFGKDDNSSFASKYCHANTGYSRNMKEMIEYFKKHKPTEMQGAKGMTKKDLAGSKKFIYLK